MLLLLRERLVGIFVVIGATVLVAILYLTYQTTREFVGAGAWIEHTQEVLLESDKLAMTVKDTQVDGRVYLVTGDKRLLDSVSLNEQLARTHLDKLHFLVRDNPVQIDRVDSLKVLFQRHVKFNESLAMSHTGSLASLFVVSKGFEDNFLGQISRFQCTHP